MKKTYTTNTPVYSNFVNVTKKKKITYGDDITDYISFLWCSEGVERVGVVGIVRMISHSMLPLQFEVLSKELGRIISGQSDHSFSDVLINGVAIQTLQVQKQPWNVCFRAMKGGKYCKGNVTHMKMNSRNVSDNMNVLQVYLDSGKDRKLKRKIQSVPEDGLKWNFAFIVCCFISFLIGEEEGSYSDTRSLTKVKKCHVQSKSV